MDELAQLFLVIALGLLFAWYALARSVFRMIETEHPDLYRRLDSPSADKNYSKATVIGLFRLIGKRGHTALANRSLSWRCDLALVAYSSSLILIIVACVFQWIL